MFSTPSYGEWTWVAKDVNGITFYVDFERIRKHSGHVHWWTLSDYLKPSIYGDLSDRRYRQGDCKLFRHKILSLSSHKEPMGGGADSGGVTLSHGWKYPPPNSVDETILKRVCSQ
jgi:hypothetical protein